MELILVRHALPVRVEQAHGPADPELSPDGHEQARRLAEWLADEQLDALYTSPLRRAVQTAAPVADRTGLAAQIVDDVAEYDRDASEYVPIEELKASGDPRFHEILAGVGLEDAEEFASRVIGALERLVAHHRGQRVVVVCHGGVINTYLASVLGLPTDPPGFFYPNYTSIHRVAASSSGHRSVLAVNETAHLRHSGLPIGLFQT